MERQELLKLLKENKVDFTLLIKEEPDILQSLIDIEKSEPSAIKFTAEKAVRNLSENNPELFIGMEDKIFSLLKSENTFIRLGNIITCSNLAVIGTEKMFELFKDVYIPFLYSKNIAEFGNAVKGIPKIISALPLLEDDLIEPLFEADQRVFIHKGKPSPECSNVAAGKVIDVFVKISNNSLYREEMLDFAKRNLTNTRNSTKRKAEKLIKCLKDKE